MGECRENLILCYFRLGFRNKEILHALARSHGIVSIRTLQRIMQRLSLHKRKNRSDILGVAIFITQQCHESGCQHGYRWMHSKCISEGFTVSQELVRELLNIIDPEGVKCHSKRWLRRRKYNSPGSNAVWHIDE
jgi:hypothetical protein